VYNEDGIRGFEEADSVVPGVSRMTIIRWTHAIAAVIAAVVLVTQSTHISTHQGITSAPAMAGWAACGVALRMVLSGSFNSERTASELDVGPVDVVVPDHHPGV